ncbi:hypothetical protein [Thalassotalea mangrovi]|uniref:Lipoprotein n=1 Tax=Thalassotalea mangrovi TaxID=2572245 RepID=A0A4U1B582_9GAMM|nr:hypothetical protein [Thalassotalea mangrovi]TKB45573.1 hypothetical protein E8M12_08220 [Thalassotalea mangrovi]
MLKKILSICLVLVLSACAGEYNTAQQVDESAYLQLQGNFLNTQLTLNDATPINITTDTINTYKFEGKTIAKLPITTGSHKIKITRGGEVLVMRSIYVSAGNSFEVTVP